MGDGNASEGFSMDPGDADGIEDQRQSYTWFRGAVPPGGRTFSFYCAVAPGLAPPSAANDAQLIVEFFPTQLA